MLRRRRAVLAALVALTLAVLTLAVLGLGATAAAAESVPAPGVCVDTQGVLGAQTCAQVTTLLAADEQATTDQIAVLVVDSTDGASIESYATSAFNTWGVGQDGVDNGVLLVVALQDRALRIEVGAGLSAKLSDGQASEIVGGTIVPQFKAGQYRTGILHGLDAVRVALGHPFTDATRLSAVPADAGYVAPYVADAAPAYSPPTYSSSSPTSSGSSVPWWPFLLLLAVLVISWMMRASNGGDASGGYSSGYRSRSSWSSGRSSSSSSSSSRSRSSSSGSSRRSGGFGGGRSSGGGASGTW